MSTDSGLGTATVVFTDLEGSTDLRTRLGDELAHERIRIHEEIIREQIPKFEGFEAKALGDGFMIVFGSARQAINCSVGIQVAIEGHNRTDPARAVKVRIGINSGEVTREGDDVYGAAVNAAARICAKAQGGQILIPQVVKDLAGFVPDLRIVDRGLYWLKGFPQRWRLHEVMWRARGDEVVEHADVPAIPRIRTDVPELPRAQAPIIGRASELAAIDEELERVATGTLRVLALEGEAGIGKTRLLEAAAEAATRKDLAVLRVGADEELRGPFFIFRALFATAAAETVAEEAVALEALDRAKDALAGRDAQHQAGLSPQEQMLHVFDEVASAIRALASGSPLALLLDDVQWADEDSLRLLRYIARTIAASPILILMTVREQVESPTGGTAHLLADLDRMHLARRVRLARFSKKQTAELLRNLLGAPVADETLDMLHARAEGVPFFVEEFARAYRESKALQQVGETWVMTQLTGPSVPASVQSLIERRLAQGTPEARTMLADAAILGRRFRLTDLARVMSSSGSEATPFALAEVLEPAVDLGLISEAPEGSNYDYTFTHEQVRATLQESQSRTRRRLVHLTIVDLLSAEVEDRANLSALAHHAIQAGDEKLGVSCSIKAARASLEIHAPEESVRVVDAARASASVPQERAELLCVKDDALALLERGEERLANLAELSAIVGAVGDPLLELDVKLRRASASRMIDEYESAAELATQVREAARLREDPKLELKACLELGQAYLRSPLGESFMPLLEADFESAREPFERAAELAKQLGERSLLAAALRELGVVEIAGAKHRGIDIMEGGATLRQQLVFDPVTMQHFEKAKGYITESLHLYEELGDRRGEMSALISLAYASITDFTRRGLAGRLEQIRRLRTGLHRMTTESERLSDEAQMLFSIHIYAQSHLILDLALVRGREGYEAARAIGDRWFESLFAGGMARSHLLLGDVDEADAWIDRAETAAVAAPRQFLARRLEALLGLLAAARGEGAKMLEHLERAVNLATEHGSPAGRCENLALLAIEAAKLGASSGDDALLDRALLGAEEAREVGKSLPGFLPWEAEAWAATALVRLTRGEDVTAADAARSALAAIEPRFTRAPYLDVIWVAGRVLIGQQAPEAQDLRNEILEDLFMIDKSTVDPEVKSRFFALPRITELAELCGFAGFQIELPAPWLEAGLDESEIVILQQLVTGKSDAEIASAIDVTESDITEHLDAIFTKLGVSNRTAAKEYALTGGIA